MLNASPDSPPAKQEEIAVKANCRLHWRYQKKEDKGMKETANSPVPEMAPTASPKTWERNAVEGATDGTTAPKLNWTKGLNVARAATRQLVLALTVMALHLGPGTSTETLKARHSAKTDASERQACALDGPKRGRQSEEIRNLEPRQALEPEQREQALEPESVLSKRDKEKPGHGLKPGPTTSIPVGPWMAPVEGPRPRRWQGVKPGPDLAPKPVPASAPSPGYLASLALLLMSVLLAQRPLP